MTRDPGGVAQAVSHAASIEAQLSAKLAQAAHEMTRMEFFDQEQRAEIHTILQAMKADTDVHREVVGRWVSDVTGEVSDV